MTHHQQVLKKTFFDWLPLAAAIIILSALACVATQQNYRMSAYDPEIQIAEDAANAVNQGKATIDQLVPATPTMDVTDSLLPFGITYSATGTPVGASAGLDGKIPPLPAGVADFSKAHGEDRITWQPKTGARFAAIIKYFGGATPGYILVGRSLREVEIREDNLYKMSAVAALLALLASFAVMWLVKKYEVKPEEAHHHTEEHTHHHIES